MDCELCGSSLCAHGLCRNTGDPWTDGCAKSRGSYGYQCQDCGEAQEQQRIADYYGGDTPQTDRERQEIAYREFKGVR
jgi:ribosomal protein L32